MIENIQREISPLLPLLIEFASGENDNLNLGGEGWTLNSDCAWRVTNGGLLEFGWSDEAIRPRLAELVGCAIVGVDAQSAGGPTDPAFRLSDGRMMEIFSDHAIDPWVFRLTGFTFVGSPSDPDSLLD